MTEEEKKAIEHFEKEIEQFKKVQETADREIDDKNWFGKLWCELQNDIDKRTTILNLIQKQQAVTEKYKYLYQKALDDTIQSDRENMRKDKIIDEMARFIADLDIDEDICKHQVAEFCEGTDGVSLDICVKCIKQYFKKVSDGDE